MKSLEGDSWELREKKIIPDVVLDLFNPRFNMVQDVFPPSSEKEKVLEGAALNFDTGEEILTRNNGNRVRISAWGTRGRPYGFRDTWHHNVRVCVYPFCPTRGFIPRSRYGSRQGAKATHNIIMIRSVSRSFYAIKSWPPIIAAVSGCLLGCIRNAFEMHSLVIFSRTLCFEYISRSTFADSTDTRFVSWKLT